MPRAHPRTTLAILALGALLAQAPVRAQTSEPCAGADPSAAQACSDPPAGCDAGRPAARLGGGTARRPGRPGLCRDAAHQRLGPQLCRPHRRRTAARHACQRRRRPVRHAPEERRLCVHAGHSRRRAAADGTASVVPAEHHRAVTADNMPGLASTSRSNTRPRRRSSAAGGRDRLRSGPELRFEISHYRTLTP